MAGAGPLALSALLLLWPAVVNGYPLVFSDTGTYLSQAIHHYLGWDRPVFYSLFLLPLHMRLTTWPVIVVQALLTAGILQLVRRSLRPELSVWWLMPLAAVLALVSPLAVVTDELMPDLFTALLVLALALLIMVPERLSRREQLCLAVFAAFAITTHLSNLPLTLVLLAVLLPLRCRLGAVAPLGRGGLARLGGVPAAAAAAMIAVNLAGHGVASLAPFGNVFLLARVLYDGPGMDALVRDCPQPRWRLCAWRGNFPVDADDFLWRPDSPLYRAGGPKLVSAEASAIIVAAVHAEPLRELRAVVANGMRQLLLFATGDGLQPWPVSVTPWIERDFPAFERAEYERARQTEGRGVLPGWIPGLDTAASVAGLAVCLVLLPGVLRRHSPIGGFIVAMLVALAANALITGGLSGPHDRYQSRLMWLPTLLALLAVPASVRLPRTTGLGIRIVSSR